MAARHLRVQAQASELVASPAGKGLFAAIAVGTILGASLPTASAQESSNTPSSTVETTDAAGHLTITEQTKAVNASSDSTWHIDQGAISGASVSSAIEAPGTSQTRGQASAAQSADAQPAREGSRSSRGDAKVTGSRGGASTAGSLASAPAPSASASSVVSFAMQYVGRVPYVWGGTSPAGWDCSGFVAYVYAHFGRSLPHSSGAIANMGTRISQSQARPGDILYWPGHVAIYAGNGKIVEAANPGAGTRYGAVWGNPVYVRL